MKRLDLNCFVGGWPFHKVRNNNLDALKKLHEKNEISGGFVSSTEAIFFNDPYEADLELAKILNNDSAYHHVITVNPMLPGFCDDIKRAVSELNIKGIRILPGVHGYTLDCEQVEQLCELLREYKLPLFLMMRLEDERVTYLFHPQNVPFWDVTSFLSINKDIPTIVCNIRAGDLIWMKDVFNFRSNVFADCSGLKDGLFCIENLAENGLADKLVYGSFTPLFCLKSTLLLVEKAEIPKKTRDAILSGEGFIRSIKKD